MIPAGYDETNGQFIRGASGIGFVETYTVPVDFTQLQTAGLTNNLTIFDAGAVGSFSVLNSQIETVASGVGTTDLGFSLGYNLGGSESALIAEYDAMAAPPNLGNQDVIGFILPSSGVTVVLYAVSDIDNLSDLSAGEWQVRIAICRWAD